MASPTDLYALAEEFLAACEEALNEVPTYDPALGGAPDRSFVTFHRPIFDCCPQLTVNVGPITEGATAPQPPKTAHSRINRATLVATIIRCVPSHPIEDPDEAALAAQQIYADRWALWNGIFNQIAEGTLFDKCGNVIWLSLTPIQTEASAECYGSVLTLSVSLDGYPPTFGT